MRNKNWLRYGFASLILAAGGAAAILAGCTSDDSTDEPVVNADAQTTEDGSVETTDGATADATADSGPQEPGKIILVHGVTDLGPNSGTGFARVCFALGTTANDALVAGLAPQPAVASPGLPWAGIPIGTGGPFGSTGISLDQLVVVPYLMNADALAALNSSTDGGTATMTCTDLLKNAVYLNGDAGTPDAGNAPVLVEGIHFWRLDPIAAGTVKNNGTYVLATSGCPADSTAPSAKCGPGFTATPGVPGRGNLNISVYSLDRAATVAADQVGAQFIHNSPQIQAFVQGLGASSVFPGFVATTPAPADAGADAAPTQTYTPFAGEAGVSFPQSAATPAASAKVTLDDVIAAGPPGSPFFAFQMTLSQINQLSAPTPDAGNDIALGKNFVFVAVGDPSIDIQDAGNQINMLKAAHFLGFPVNPNVPKLQ